MQRLGAVLLREHFAGIAVFNHDAAKPIDERRQVAREVPPILRRMRPGSERVRSKARRPAGPGACGEAHERADEEPARALDRVARALARPIKFNARKRCKSQDFAQPIGLGRIAQHAKQIDDLVVEIVVDLGVGARLAKEHARSAAERLDIDAVRRKVRNDPGREEPFPAMPAQKRSLWAALVAGKPQCHGWAPSRLSQPVKPQWFVPGCRTAHAKS